MILLTLPPIPASATWAEGFVSLPKLLAALVLFILWMLLAQWVNRDTAVVKTNRGQWNIITLLGGIAGLGIFLLPPWPGGLFAAGMGLYLVVAGGALMAYVMHRNGRVAPAARVGTISHIKRSLGGFRSGRKSGIELSERVKIIGADRKRVVMPGDDETELHVPFNTVQELLFDAMWRRATEVALAFTEDDAKLMYSIDGVPTKREGLLTKAEAEELMVYLKQLAGLDVAERRRPQEGKIQAGMLGAKEDPAQIEVCTAGSTQGERMQLKVRGQESQKRLDTLGFNPRTLALMKRCVNEPAGLFIVSGPKRSGITTAMYAILLSHDAFLSNIYTLERKPIWELDNITQTKYDSKGNTVSYARQLQSVFRREPDVVMVGECDDREIAQVASRAAKDERKVYVGMEADNCFEALKKYAGFMEDMNKVADSLVGISNQRLVRILCTECRQAYRPDEKLLKKANIPSDKIEHFYRPPTEPVLDKKGREVVCPKCQGTGYYGRVGVLELMVVDDSVRKLLREGADVNSIKAQCRRNKMFYLQEEALLKVIDATTSINEVLRSIRSKSA